MAAKPETTFTQSITRHLPRDLYRMKNNNPFLGGVPDLWFSGNKADLWLEMKFLPRMPQRASVKPFELLSALQLKWLNERYGEGRNVGVIIGCPIGGVLLQDLAWNSEIIAQNFEALVRSRTDLARWIVEQTTR